MPKYPPDPPPYPSEPFWRALEVLGIEVGDYGRDSHLVEWKGALYAVRLEGWGDECAMDVPAKDRAAALVQRSEALAESWRKEGWSAGTLAFDESVVGDVPYLTWGVMGPVEVDPDDYDPEEVIR